MDGILTLDMATVTGWAFWKTGMAQPRHGVWRMPQTGEDVGLFLKAFRQKFSDFCALEKPQYIGFEAPFVGQLTSQATARKLMSLAGVIELFILDLDGPQSFETNITQVRKHFAGRGMGKSEVMKRLVYDTCFSLGWQPDDDNAADALSIMHYSTYQLRKYLSVPWDCRPHAQRVMGPQLGGQAHAS